MGAVKTYPCHDNPCKAGTSLHRAGMTPSRQLVMEVRSLAAMYEHQAHLLRAGNFARAVSQCVGNICLELWNLLREEGRWGRDR